MKQRIYTDTSVIGGCLDEEFQEPSIDLMNAFITGEAIIVLSELTMLELEEAPALVRSVLDEIPDANKEYVYLTEEARELSLNYINSEVIGRSNYVDALHIAIATTNRVDVLVSWNFRHIVNLQRIHGFNSVNLKLGYPLLEIRTPREAISYEEG